jgi:4,5-dihydroxyphthalate decarboxylase
VAPIGASAVCSPTFATSSSQYARKTGIFPIMHVVALRREVFERHRWLPLNLLTAFDDARRRSLERAADITASHFPLPWVPDELRKLRDLMGGDPWPYGVDANRSTLEAFLSYAFEQGVCRRLVTAETLFPPEVHERSGLTSRSSLPSSGLPSSHAAPAA